MEKKQEDEGGRRRGREGERWRGKDIWRPNKGKVGERGEKTRWSDLGSFPKDWRLGSLHLLIGHSQKTEQEGAQRVLGDGLGASGGGGEQSVLLCFKIGIKQHYFGFHAEFLTSRGEPEAQARREIEMVQHSFILSMGLLGASEKKGPQ